MATMTLKATRRDVGRKGPARRLRRGGQVPAVVYGHGFAPEPVALSANDLNALIRQRSGTMIIDLKLEGGGGENRLTVIRELQREPISGRVIHVDLQRISLKEKVHVQVPLHIEGTAPGVKDEGGILEYPLRHIEIKCLPNDIPERFTIDISNLHIGDAIHVRDLALASDKFDLLSEPEMVVVTVSAPRLMKAEAEAPGEAAAGAAEAPAPGEEPAGEDKEKDKDKDKERGKGKD
jgi:large subunit ribosomal protein L25